MADKFKMVGLRTREWGRKARKAMKRMARQALKRSVQKLLRDNTHNGD